MATCITHLEVSTTEAEEQDLRSKHYNKINVKLNSGGNNVYIWYKKESGSEAINRVQVTYNQEMEDGLRKAGYIQIKKNLNAGTCKSDALYLWYARGSSDYYTPITDMDVTRHPEIEARRFYFGWERLACNLNRNAVGDWIHAWIKREKRTYICDLYVTDSFDNDYDLFQEGFIRMDEATNRGAGGAFVFIWYRQTTDRKIAITGVGVSTNDKEEETYQEQRYTSNGVHLNEGSGAHRVLLWYKQRKGDNPVRAISLLLNPAAPELFKIAGIKVLPENVSAGTSGILPNEYLCVKQ